MHRRAILSAAAACSVLSASAQRVARAQSLPRFYEAARYASDRGGAGLLIARHGIVLAEDYPGGDPAQRWPLGAATRALAPVLAASLARDRLLSLDEPASATLPEWALHPMKAAISLRTLLNGTSGLAFAPGQQQDLAAALTLEPVDVMGQHFADNAAIYVLFAEIARRKLLARGREPDPARYLMDRTLAPVGCAPMGWPRGWTMAPSSACAAWPASAN